MTNSAGSNFYVTYDLFRISDEWSDYRLTSVGDHNGTTSAFIRQCPSNTIFGPCACQGSCADPNGCIESCTVEQSCFCPSPYLLLGSDCVPQERCSCFMQEIGVISENGTYFSSDCSEHCTCEKGTLMCDRDVQCDTNAVCEKRNNVRKCYCNEGYAGDGQTCTRTAPPVLPGCYDFFTSGFPDGVYTISPTGWTGLPFEVYCNMSHGGGWTVMQRRVNRSVSFTRNWDVYKDGFGIPNHELWLGNEKLSYMTNQQTFELRIDVIKEADDAHWNMNYELFRVDNEDNNYQLELGTYFGNAGFDYMTRHRNRQFSTPDRDNDDTSYRHCAALSNSGWWFGGYCWTADLNQMVNGTSHLANIHELITYRYHPVRFTQMKIRPI
ncbi:Fibrinogen C domain-containing protein 1 [Holothuria leucospilota]|uniref:Fibrinogen C domain-containing protein 1 n=1 Tax=Holothuria leucospilota TaxID=206669 RepID=A0A9Q1C013_HOLLE|nr:Fibrinogen C domain-containing protein 1 [Holothuria leucospilota]